MFVYISHVGGSATRDVIANGDVMMNGGVGMFGPVLIFTRVSWSMSNSGLIDVYETFEMS